MAMTKPAPNWQNKWYDKLEYNCSTKDIILTLFFLHVYSIPSIWQASLSSCIFGCQHDSIMHGWYSDVLKRLETIVPIFTKMNLKILNYSDFLTTKCIYFVYESRSKYRSSPLKLYTVLTLVTFKLNVEVETTETRPIFPKGLVES